MVEMKSNSIEKDNAQEAKLTKVIFNNFVVNIRKEVEVAVLFTIRKLTKLSAELKNKKTTCEIQKEKNERKAEHYYEQIQALKEFHEHDIVKFVILFKKSFDEVFNDPKTSAEERAFCRIVNVKKVEKLVKEFRNKYPNWAQEIPNIIKSLGVNYREERLKRLAERGRLEDTINREKRVFILLHKIVGLDIDPNMVERAGINTLKKKKKLQNKVIRKVKLKNGSSDTEIKNGTNSDVENEYIGIAMEDKSSDEDSCDQGTSDQESEASSSDNHSDQSKGRLNSESDDSNSPYKCPKFVKSFSSEDNSVLENSADNNTLNVGKALPQNTSCQSRNSVSENGCVVEDPTSRKNNKKLSMGKKRKYLKVLNSANENVPLESNNLVTNLVKESNNNNIKISSKIKGTSEVKKIYLNKMDKIERDKKEEELASSEDEEFFKKVNDDTHVKAKRDSFFLGGQNDDGDEANSPDRGNKRKLEEESDDYAVDDEEFFGKQRPNKFSRGGNRGRGNGIGRERRNLRGRGSNLTRGRGKIFQNKDSVGFMDRVEGTRRGGFRGKGEWERRGKFSHRGEDFKEEREQGGVYGGEERKVGRGGGFKDRGKRGGFHGRGGKGGFQDREKRGGFRGRGGKGGFQDREKRGGFRGRGGKGGFQDRKKGKGFKSKRDWKNRGSSNSNEIPLGTKKPESAPSSNGTSLLHPSWMAKKREKESCNLSSFKGKVTKFED